MNHSALSQGLTRRWYRPGLAFSLWPLLPLSWLFKLFYNLRRVLYRRAFLPSYGLPVAVIVVGNLTVGGSGKTPFVVWLVEHLRQRGWRPGIVSRGYGGKNSGVMAVRPDSLAAVAGDEPILLARRCGVPVFVGCDRAAAGAALLAAHPECNVIVADDGLQHYRLRRDAEVAVFDGRGAGNGRLLPAGPLREPLRRLRTVTAVVWNSALGCSFADVLPPQFAMRLVAGDFYALADPGRRCAAADLRGKRLHALAGIGDPDRFFRQLNGLGLQFEPHPFPDHHAYTSTDLDFAGDGVLLMTEKDAVKCASFPLHEAWVLPVAAHIEALPDGAAEAALLDLLLEKLDGRSPA